jgi:uncharacterized protein YecE (DUF72 family)
MRPEEFLRFYAGRLDSVELNTTGYRLPAQAHFERWAAEVPPGFRFAVKMTGRSGEGALRALDEFCRRVRQLGDSLGPIRVTLPGERDEGMLTLFLGSLDPELLWAFDLRDPSWDGVEAQLDAAGVVRVGALEATAPFRYLRFREPPYDDRALADIAASIEPALAAGNDVYAYFRHEDEPTAPRYAERLGELVAERARQ